MDYEKMYKAVLKTATQWIKDGCSDKEKICLESIFPELRESEDERIRKALIKLMTVAGESYILSATGFEKERFLSYLEKQKEQKPAEWDDYTKTNLGRAIQIIKDARGTLYGYQTDDGIYECDKAIEALEHFLYRGLEIEKSAEWSEEDKHNLNSVINLVHATTDGAWGSCIGDGIEKWLKSLPERFNLEPKEGWNEEDEENMQAIVETIKRHWLTLPGNTLIDWLKSLRPQWKPSEEQIYSLGTVVKGYDECAVGSVEYNLKEMYEQLKKL